MRDNWAFDFATKYAAEHASIAPAAEFAVTDIRFVQKDGILDIEIKEIPLYKVETVNFSQTFLQRLLGTGDIELVGSGGTTHQLTYIAHPMDVKKAISRAISNKERMQMARQAHSADEEE